MAFMRIKAKESKGGLKLWRIRDCTTKIESLQGEFFESSWRLLSLVGYWVFKLILGILDCIKGVFGFICFDVITAVNCLDIFGSILGKIGFVFGLKTKEKRGSWNPEFLVAHVFLLVFFLLMFFCSCFPACVFPAPNPKNGKLRVFIGNGVLMSGIDMTTLISVERCPRYLFKDLNPMRPVLTLLPVKCD